MNNPKYDQLYIPAVKAEAPEIEPEDSEAVEPATDAIPVPYEPDEEGGN